MVNKRDKIFSWSIILNEANKVVLLNKQRTFYHKSRTNCSIFLLFSKVQQRKHHYVREKLDIEILKIPLLR